MMGMNPPPHEQLLTAARQAMQQVMLFETQGNLMAAIAGIDQAIGFYAQSMNGAAQWGIFIPDPIHFEYGYAHATAARLKRQTGMMPAMIPQHLFMALSAINQALFINGYIPHYHVLAGNICLEQGNLRDADRAFRTALSLNPSDPYTQYMLASVNVQLGNVSAAQTFYTPFQKAQPQGLPDPVPAQQTPGAPDFMKTANDVLSLADKALKVFQGFEKAFGSFSTADQGSGF
jgi:tetratricopeptide (TPR) repeat protein